MKKFLFLIFTFLCAGAQGVWAETRVTSESDLAQAVKTDGANIVMMSDIELSQPVTIQADNGNGVTVTINMNGKKLTFKKAIGQNTASCVFIVPAGSTLNLSKGTIADVTNISGNNTKYIAGAIVNEGTATLDGITFSGCKGLLGGAIKNNEKATLNLKACTFDGNEASTKKDFDSGSGGAIWNNGKLVLTTVSIQNCKADLGAGIFNADKGSVSMSNDNNETIFSQNTANVNGGAIFSNGSMTLQHVNFKNNTAPNGGAIYVAVNGVVEIGTGSFFTDNKASTQGAAIYNGGTLKMKGSITAKQNTGADDVLNNVFLVKGKVITVTGSLKGSKIGISVPERPSVITSGYTNDHKDIAPNTIFTSDYDPDLNSAYLSDNEVSIGIPSPLIITEERVLRKALEVLDNFSMKLSNDIDLSNSTLEIPSGKTVTFDLGGFTLDRKLTKRGEGGGQVITIREGATLNLSNGTLKSGWGGVWSGPGSTLNMQGKNTITDNTRNGTTNNVFLREDVVINVTGSLADSNIGISLVGSIGTFTNGYKKSNGDVDPATVFKADKAVFFVPALSGDEAALTLQQLVKAASDADLRLAASFDGANIQLANDIKMSNSTLVIGEGKTVTIDLNGKTLDRGLTSRDFDHGGQVITVRKDAILNLSNGKLTGGYGGNGGGLANEGGTATLTDVTITGCTGDQRGGGISNAGTLTMTGGSLTNNTSNDIKASSSDQTAGGGLFNFKGATATLTGVTITGNKNKVYGGGGICNFGTLNIDGCTVTGNTAGANGGAIWQEGTLNLQGKNTITDNQAGGKANNIYLYNTVITVTGSLEGSQIGIRMENPGTFTSGYSTNNKDVAPVKYFLSDNDDYIVILKDNEAELKKKMEDGIRSASMDNEQLIMDNSWYTLDGRKIQGKPTTKGVYIHNGKKVAQ